ncbi:putative ATP-dependent RNA helicase DHX33 [Smittium culicis]|uniref:RNA helicase n=1 Tax=Smittium culicis TaxID=133412 RepID=A0A1R1XCR6_9FUNG|nr:putative ATP-dependent RNA helicase DHX33 [Smittium culicis]
MKNKNKSESFNKSKKNGIPKNELTSNNHSSDNSNSNKSDLNIKSQKLLKQRQELPIFSAKREIVDYIYKNKTVILVGETGSGKTTQIPQFLYEEGLVRKNNCAIAITQPRRVAATSISKRVADEVGTKLGARVGYTIRFDDCSSKYTKIKYLTDGMLLREVLSDPLLLKYRIVILDEAHERTLRTDVLFGMLKEIQVKREKLAKDQREKMRSLKASEMHKAPLNVRGPKTHVKFDNSDSESESESDAKEAIIKKVKVQEDEIFELKIVVMSATLDAEKFSNYFNGAPILYVSGRQYPVKIKYTYEPQNDYLDAAHLTVMQTHLETNTDSGDILVFLSGQEEIESLEKLIRETSKHLPKSKKGLVVAPIYAALPQNLQNKVFEKLPSDHRKVVLATNIAETSITIPGIRYVIDTGVHKVRGFDARVGVESLLVEPVSKSSARQRAGRAGRIDSGVCYRLYTENDFEKLTEDDVPEIMRRQLTSVILMLKASGIDDVIGFDYMDPPSKSALKNALLELYSLEALDDSGKLTDLGKWMAEFPLDPVYSKVLYESIKHKCTSEALDLVAALSVDSLFYSPIDNREAAFNAHKQFQSLNGDHWTVINLLKAFNEYKNNSSKVVIFDQLENDPDSFELYENANNKDKSSSDKLEFWCKKNFVSFRNLSHVIRIRQQISNLASNLNIDVSTSCGDDTDTVLICLLSGFFYKCAMLQPDGTYRSLTGSQTVHIHPTSSMFRKKTAAIVYDQLVFTNKLYAKSVSAIQPGWLSIAAPRLYGNNSF